MKKLKLDELAVESFATSEGGIGTGTVRAHALTPTCTNTMPVPWCTNCTELAECCSHCAPGCG